MSTTNSAAKLMNADDRKELALKALKKDKSVSKLAEQNDVSRKFVHKQKNKLVNAIDSAFSETDATNDAHKVLYYIPVTKQYISLMVVCLLLFSRCSFRGIRRFLSVCLDYEISQGGIHNIAAVAIQRAEKINSQEDLSQAKLVANVEKFHLNKPILSGTDIRSLYCYLLRLEDTRDGDTWARNLLELKKKHFLPEAVYGDDGSGLYDGHKLVMPDVPYHRDHFHIIHELLEVRRYFRNRKKSSITYLNQRENKYYKAITKGNEALHEEQLFMAVKEAGQAGHLSSSIDTLVDWLCHDVLVKAGPAPEQRSELYDFIVNELKTLELIHPHRIKSIRVMLENAKHLALSFMMTIDNKFQVIAESNNISVNTLWKIAELQRCKEGSMKYAVRALPLQDELGDDFYDIEELVTRVLEGTERTSSMAENLHSRISPYLFVRKQVGNGFLNLLRFFLNHEKIERSEKSFRHQKTPAHILTGQEHPHWVEMLGFKRFQRAA